MGERNDDICGHVLRTVRNYEDAHAVSIEWGYGRPLNLAQMTHDHWRAIMRGAGLMDGDKPRFTMHAMRHAYASLLIEKGLPALNLKTVMGHSKVETTYGVYGHLFPGDDRTATAVASISADFSAATERHKPISL